MTLHRNGVEIARSAGRWRLVLASLGAAVISVPFGWLLSYLAFHFLGLFFFTLAGLIFGAVAFRWARVSAPVSRTTAVIMSSFIVGTCWLTSIVVEARALPGLVAEPQLKIRHLPEGVSLEQYHQKQVRFAADRLNAEAWPGGVIGYIRWVVTDGELDLRDGAGPVQVYQAKQKSWWWVGRVVLSIALLGFGVYSQVKGLVAKARYVPDSNSGLSPDPGSPAMESAAHVGSQGPP